MTNELLEPTETDSFDCHLQNIGMGTLICRAAAQKGKHSTNEVSVKNCFNCEAGKIYREIGCDGILPKLQVFASLSGSSLHIESLFCKIRRRETTFDYCQTCGLVVAETTRKIVSITRGLFEAQGFYSAYKDLEKARESMRDGNFENTITRSIACLESTMRICHEKLGKPLPKSKQVANLWKSTRTVLQFDEMEKSDALSKVLNSLSGVVSSLGGLRNSLGDAHGRGLYPPDVSETIAELAINTALTLATIVIRRLNQIQIGAE